MESDSISDNQQLIDDFAREYQKEHERTVSDWRAENPAVNRYFDLYRAAHLQITMGTIVKVVGVIIGILIFLVMFLAGWSGSTAAQTESGVNFFFGGLLSGAICGVVVGGIVFLFGVMISAIGQLLLAQADTAIHTSPFLTKEEKARAMSLAYRA